MNRNHLLILLARQNRKQNKNQQFESLIPVNRIYNLNITRDDPTKLHYKRITLKVPLKIPLKIDLRYQFPPVYDQGNLGSCTANALCGVIGFEEPTIKGSRLFLYYNERMLINTVNTDSGAYLYDGIATLKEYGICQESEWEYDITKFADKPPEECYKNALSYTALQVQNISNNMTQMKYCLINNDPFVVGIAIFSSFESIQVARTGMVPMPTRKDKLLGGHAVVCVGYDDTKKVWIMRNSWSSRWGNRGYFFLPYAYLLNPSLSSDLWCIQKMNKI